MAKYNWQELEKEYIYGNYKSISAFLKEKKIPKNNTSQNKTKNWNQKKQRKENKIATRVEEKVIELESKNKVKEIVEFNDLSKIAMQKAKTLSQEIDSIYKLESYTKSLNKIKGIIADEKEEIEKVPVFIPAKDIGKAFVDLNRDIDEKKHSDYWLEGGRGSVKSSFWSEKVSELLENNENMCAILIRKVGNTMKDSVYAQMQWGIDKLSETYPFIKDKWQALKSPIEFHNKSTNQKIYLRGADDPGKIKSIKPPPGKYIGIIVYEEFDQMNGMNEVGTIDRSLVRGGDYFVIFRVYNTPKSKNHFVNKEKRIPKPNRLIHRSTYLDVPIEWLGKPFFDEADYMKEVNPKGYENIYLGEETGDGGNVFENVELKEISDQEIGNFDYLYQGLDFGWFPDPLAWTKMCFQSNERTLYIFDEYVVNKMSNADVWEHLKNDKNVANDDLITADSAEEKSIGDFQSYGSLTRGAKKGPGSVEYSMKWLSSLVKIIIDPKRCPKTAEEFTMYEYQTDKDGNYISGYVDKNNHCIDSVRYALNPIWRRKGE